MIGRANSNQAAKGMHTAHAEVPLVSRGELDDPEIGLASLVPTSKQNWSALAVVAVLLVAFGIVAPFAATPLPRFDRFIPSLNSAISITDLITSVLLFVQFWTYRSRALLALAIGYLFTALIIIPHTLTFPSTASPTGLLGAGIQSAAWIYIFWHFGFPAALFVYAWLNDEKRAKYAMQGSMRSIIGWSVGITIILVCGLTWVAIARDQYLPRLFLDMTHYSPLGRYVPIFNVLACGLALVFMWTCRRRSVLDLWLMVVACAFIGELSVTVAVTRFSLGFYVSRIFSLVTSTVVLVILLAEMARLYARLADTNMMLQRERNNKLMTLEAVVGSISHEVKQPLAAIMMRGSTALRFLGHTPPDLEKTRSALNKIVSDGNRASQIFNNIRDLFRDTGQKQQAIDVSEMTRGVLQTLHGDLIDHGITTRTELSPGLPPVMGHRGQLEEVIINLVRNAIEAMDAIKDGNRVLRVKTMHHDSDGIIVAVEDSGPGIDPEKLGGIFDAFVTTKPQGMGLGLALCRMIVERHGGQLLASSSEKKGAIFQITLPIKSAAATA